MDDMYYLLLIVDDDESMRTQLKFWAEDLKEDYIVEEYLNKRTGIERIIGHIEAEENAIEAVKTVADYYRKHPDMTILVLADYKMYDRSEEIDQKILLDLATGLKKDVSSVVTGTDLTDYLRETFAGKKIGHLIVTAFADEIELPLTREQGVFEVIGKPMDMDKLAESTLNLLKSIYAKEIHPKKKVIHTFNFRKIVETDDFVKYLQLREKEFSFLNYLQQRPKRPDDVRGLDLDKFDPYSIPYGGFVDVDGEEICVVTGRAIRQEIQSFYADMIYEVLKQYDYEIDLLTDKLDPHKIRTLSDFVYKVDKDQFPTAETFNIDNLIRKHEKDGSKTGEYSRYIVREGWRGYGLSTMIILSTIAETRSSDGPQMVFGECVPQMAKMYRKYGWELVPGLSMKLEEKVQQQAVAMVVNVMTDVPEHYDRIITEFIIPQLSEKNNFTYPLQ